MLKKSIFYICIGLMAVASLGFILGMQQKPIPKYDPFPTYPLQDLSGETYRFKKEKMKLITFFYSRCPDICPITIHDLTKLYDDLKKDGLLAEEVDILTITLDPETDTEEILTQYSQAFEIPLDEHWYFLRGSDLDIAKLTEDLGFYREETGGYWSHSTTIYLVDYENRKRTFYQMSGPKVPLDIEKIVRDIHLLKKEHNKVVNQ